MHRNSFKTKLPNLLAMETYKLYLDRGRSIEDIYTYDPRSKLRKGKEKHGINWLEPEVVGGVVGWGANGVILESMVQAFMISFLFSFPLFWDGRCLYYSFLRRYGC